jgi:hypothetical protein
LHFAGEWSVSANCVPQVVQMKLGMAFPFAVIFGYFGANRQEVRPVGVFTEPVFVIMECGETSEEQSNASTVFREIEVLLR